MERIAIVVTIVILLFLLGRLGSKISSKHTGNEHRDPANGVDDQQAETGV